MLKKIRILLLAAPEANQSLTAILDGSLCPVRTEGDSIVFSHRYG